MMRSTSLEIVQGDTGIFDLSIFDSNCVPKDLTSFDIVFTIKQSYTDSLADALFQGSLTGGQIVFIDEVAGLIEVTVPASVTLNMRSGRPYPWDCVISKVDQFFTVDRGAIFVDSAVSDYD